MNVPFLRPAIADEDIADAARVLKSGWLLLGQETKKFEEEFASYLGVKRAVMINNCTNAIHISLVLAGVEEGDEVIVTPMTYVSSITPVLHLRAKPVFVDVDASTGLLDLALVEQAMTPKTKAIIPVHLYGQMIDMKALKALTDPKGIAIIEDAAHAIEAERDGIGCGEEGFTACFSFHAAKNLTAGTGGALATNNDALADKALLLRRDGVRAGVHRRMEELGFRAFPTEFQAALLRGQLKRLDSLWENRKRLHDRYTSILGERGIWVNPVLPHSRHGHHMTVIHVEQSRRDSIRDAMAKDGIETSIHYDPVHLEPYFQEHLGTKRGDFPVAESMGLSTITLPIFPGLTEEEQNAVIASTLKHAL